MYSFPVVTFSEEEVYSKLPDRVVRLARKSLGLAPGDASRDLQIYRMNHFELLYRVLEKIGIDPANTDLILSVGHSEDYVAELKAASKYPTAAPGHPEASGGGQEDNAVLPRIN